jgi:hypothetical protein
VLLRDIHATLISQYDCKEVCAPSQSQGNVGTSTRLSSQDGVPQQQEAAPLSLPRLDRLFEASFARDESSVSNADVAAIPSQLKVTKQILIHWQSFRDLKVKYVGSRQAEQLSLRSQQRIVATVEECLVLEVKRWPNNGADGRVQGRGAQITVPTSHSIFQQRDHSHAELSFRLCILTGHEPRAVKM